VLGFKLGLQIRQLGGGGNQMQVFEPRLDDRRPGLLAFGTAGQHLLEEVRHAGGNLVTTQPGEVMTGVGLCVQIDQQGVVALRRTDGRQVAGNTGLAYTTLLIEHHPAHFTSPA